MPINKNKMSKSVKEEIIDETILNNEYMLTGVVDSLSQGVRKEIDKIYINKYGDLFTKMSKESRMIQEYNIEFTKEIIVQISKYILNQDKCD